MHGLQPPLRPQRRRFPGGWPAYRVTDPRFPDYDSLYRYLTGIFSQEMVDNTLSSGGNYVNVDGALSQP